MPVWRCPHCGTPQAESSRCWVCRRSTTACATCRHFRRSVVSGLGLCGLDPRHTALQGTEIRACWAAPDPSTLDVDPPPGDRRAVPVGPGLASVPPGETTARRPRTFVPIEDLVAAVVPAVSVIAGTGTASAVGSASAPAGASSSSAVTAATAGPAPAGARRVAGWSLWDDLEAEP